MRTDGAPVGDAVASATASGTSSSPPASANQLWNCSSGSAARSARCSSGSLLSAVLREQPVLDRVADELRARGDAELLHDPRPVRLCGSHREEEHLCDLLVRVAKS